MKEAIAQLPRFLVTPTVSKYRIFVWLEVPCNADHQLYVFARHDDCLFGVLQSRFHEVWALKQGTRLETRPRYTPTTCFETFPFPFPDDLEPPAPPAPKPSCKPKQPEPDRTAAEMMAAHFYCAKEEPPPYDSGSGPESAPSSLPVGDQSRLTSAATREEHRAAIATAAKELNELRERWLNPPEWTETRYLEFPGTVGGPWDRYIDKAEVRSEKSGVRIGLVRYPRLEPRDAECAAKLKKRTLTNLYNERPAWLDLAHKKLDAAVAAAYGWPADLTDEQILERLLALNLERAAEEAKAAKVKKPKAQRAKSAQELI
jgi:hypothetical protein